MTASYGCSCHYSMGLLSSPCCTPWVRWFTGLSSKYYAVLCSLQGPGPLHVSCVLLQKVPAQQKQDKDCRIEDCRIGHSWNIYSRLRQRTSNNDWNRWSKPLITLSSPTITMMWSHTSHAFLFHYWLLSCWYYYVAHHQNCVKGRGLPDVHNL